MVDVKATCQWLAKFCNVLEEESKCGDEITFRNLKPMHSHILDVMSLLLDVPNDPQVLSADKLADSNGKAVWLETHNGKVYTGWVLVYDRMTNGLVPGERIGLTQPGGHNSWLMLKQYGRTWRCWDREPTEEQKEAAPWES